MAPNLGSGARRREPGARPLSGRRAFEFSATGRNQPGRAEDFDQGGDGESANHGTAPTLARNQRAGSAGVGGRLAQAAFVTSPAGQWLPRIFAGLLGAFLGLSLLKFGNPPIMEKWVTAPSDVYELVLGYPWPISWAYRLLGLVVIVGACVAARRFAGPVGTRSTASHSSSLPGSPTPPRWLFALPLPWLVWQFLAATQTMDS